MDPSYPVTGIDCWSGGAQVKRKHLRSSRASTPPKRSGRVNSRRNPSDDQVSFVVCFLIPLPRRGVGAYIVGVVDHSYLATWLPLWLTMSSYTSTMPVVLARELRNLNGVGGDPTKQELGNLNGARADPTEHEPGNWNGVGVYPTKQGLENLNVTRADPTEQGLGNWNGAKVDSTEHELGNLNVAGADPTEQELRNWNGARAYPTEHELGNLNVAGAQELGWRKS
ncbi:hypothetical protein B296_00020423 [Ensete ventricosum]|uniref:Uncharacterized protein n=1 Tax=Ensete ventricosum TaxID=4639 RepID=A0A426Y9Q7_ENSVE|nr:hypothetical protein B296_00020423 [Ensete ventricosum]